MAASSPCLFLDKKEAERRKKHQEFQSLNTKLPPFLTNRPLLDDGKHSWSLKTFTLALSNQFLLRVDPATPWIINCEQAVLQVSITVSSPALQRERCHWLLPLRKSTDHGQSKAAGHPPWAGAEDSAFSLSAVNPSVSLFLSRSFHTVTFVFLWGFFSSYSLHIALILETCTCQSLNGVSRTAE